MTKLSFCLLGFVLGLVAVASAEIDVEAGPQEEAYQGVPYRSGGVGTEERAALERAGEAYNLKLIFARTQNTSFVSDVQVRVTDSGGGVVLDAISHGPWFYTRLPAGTYRVAATIGSETKEESVKIADGRQSRLAFYWDIQRD